MVEILVLLSFLIGVPAIMFASYKATKGASLKKGSSVPALERWIDRYDKALFELFDEEEAVKVADGERRLPSEPRPSTQRVKPALSYGWKPGAVWNVSGVEAFSSNGFNHGWDPLCLSCRMGARVPHKPNYRRPRAGRVHEMYR